MTPHEINRRVFLQRTGLVAGLASVGMVSEVPFAAGMTQGSGAKTVALLRDPDDKILAADPARWAFNLLLSTLNGKGVHSVGVENAQVSILAGGSAARMSRELLDRAISTGIVQIQRRRRPLT